jgi:hypothetical protein
MTAILPLLMLGLLFAVVATCFAEGMWSNAVRLVNVVTAALLAMNFFEPLSDWLDSKDSSYTYLWDFLVLWGLFGIFLVIFRELTDHISKVQVRFLKLADRIGSVVLSIVVGCVMVAFTLTTLHTAPLGRTFLWDGFSTDADERMVFGTGPDRMWLGFTRNLSTGAFGRSETREFNAKDEFMPKYHSRRKLLEENVKSKDSLRVP